VILIPEIPFDYDSIAHKISEREQAGKHFSIVVVAEGARPAGGGFVTSTDQPDNREARLGGIGAQVAEEIHKRTGKDSRCVVLGHLQRGGSPSNLDRALCTAFGAKAVELIAEKKFGHRLGQLGLPDAGRAEKEQDPVGPIEAVLQRSLVQHQTMRDRVDRLLLADDPLLQPRLDVLEPVVHVAADHVLWNLRGM